MLLNTTDIILSVVGGLILLLGIVSNSLSLTYFVLQEKNKAMRRDREKTISRSFILLSTFDLLVCVFGICNSLTDLWSSSSAGLAGYVTLGILLLSVQLTWFITCLLAITRAIHVCFPHYNIKWRVVNVATAAYGLIAFASCALQILDAFPAYYPDHVENKVEMAEFFLLAVMYGIILISNIVCVVKLSSPHNRNTTWKREATITVIVLSVFFLVLNTGYLVR